MMPLYQNPILSAIYAQAQNNPQQTKIAIQETSGKAITYAQLVAAIEAVALALLEQGFQAGDRVLLLLRPNIDLMIAALAVVRLGGVLVLADPAMGRAIFAERMALAAPKWVFTETLFLLLEKLPFVRQFLKRRGIEIPEIQTLPNCQIINVGGLPVWGTLSMNAMKHTKPRGKIEELPCDLTADVTIVFTSGTTGKPKGVVHTLGSMLATIERINEYIKPQPSDVIYDTGILLLLPALMQGAGTVLGTGKFRAKTTIAALKRYQVSKTIEIPARVLEMLEYLDSVGEKFPQPLDDLMLGAAPIYTDFLKKFQNYSLPKLRVWSIYGMTELLPAAFVPMEEKLAFDNRAGDLVGMPMRGIEAALAEDGELLLTGAGLFDRYLGDTPSNQHATGDLARIDSAGRIILLGRKKDMIIRGHYNIYPALYEPIIRQIKGVVDAALVGLYNPAKADEEIILFIEADPHEKDLEAFRKRLQSALLSGEQSIDLYAQADYIFFEKLPYSGRSQKLDKKALRSRAAALLGQSEEAQL